MSNEALLIYALTHIVFLCIIFRIFLRNILSSKNDFRNEEEQNVEAFQFQGKIYFRTIKNIAKRSELLFWYDKKYAEFLGLLTKEASRKKMEELAALPLSNNVLD